MPQPATRLHIAVSGSYSSGKTTTAEALSVATGIPRADALTAREIVVDLVPSKHFKQLSAVELLMLGLRRFEERVHSEAALDGRFVADGSVLHEWVYGEARLRLGMNPGASLPRRAAVRVATAPMLPFLRQYMQAYGNVVKERALRMYDVFIHLPVEFEMDRDGHRPVSEEYRRVSDELLVQTLDELEIPYHVVGGTVRERVQRIVELLELELVVPVDEAIAIAAQRIARSKDMVAERQLANQALRRKVLGRIA
jgi:nicotinamide riboside kinase